MSHLDATDLPRSILLLIQIQISSRLLLRLLFILLRIQDRGVYRLSILPSVRSQLRRVLPAVVGQLRDHLVPDVDFVLVGHVHVHVHVHFDLDTSVMDDCDCDCEYH